MILGTPGTFLDMVWLSDLHFMDLFFKLQGLGSKFFNFMLAIVSMDICFSKIVNRLPKNELIVHAVV